MSRSRNFHPSRPSTSLRAVSLSNRAREQAVNPSRPSGPDGPSGPRGDSKGAVNGGRNLFLWVWLTVVFLQAALAVPAQAQTPTCSRQWLDNWCTVGCTEARSCCTEVVNFWADRQAECAKDPVAVKRKVELGCESCNRFNCDRSQVGVAPARQPADRVEYTSASSVTSQDASENFPSSLAEALKNYQTEDRSLQVLGERIQRSNSSLFHKLITDPLTFTFGGVISNTTPAVTFSGISITEFDAKPTVALSYHLPFWSYFEFGGSLALVTPDDTLKVGKLGVAEVTKAFEMAKRVYLQFNLPFGELREDKRLKKDLDRQEAERDKARDALLERIAERLANTAE